MSKILELRSKRNTLWEQTKAFLEQHRGENGLVAADAVEQYNKMAQEVKDLGAEIERLEQQAEFDAKLSAPTSNPVHGDPKNGSPKDKDTSPTGTEEYKNAFWDMIRNRGNYGEVRNALSVGVDTEGGYTVPDEFEKKLVEALEENNIFRSMANVIRTSSGTRKIPIAEDTGEASWIDEGEEIPESDTTFGQTMLSAYKLGTMIKVSNELLNDSAFDLATYIARRFGVRMGNAEEKAFITGDGVGKPLGILDDAGAKVGVTAGTQTKLTFDEIFQLYYALKAPYRKKAEFLCNEAVVLQLMTLKGRVDIQFILFIHFLTSLRIKRGDTIYLVIPKFNPISQPIKCFDSGENIYRITIHPKTSTVEFKFIVNIQRFYKTMQQLVPIYMHSLFQMSHLG